MIPIEPKVARVSPRCARCGSNQRLIRGDGPVVCRDCVHMAGRLANVARHDDVAREGWRP